MSDKTTKLLDCPCCGGEALVWFADDKHFPRTYVSCAKCGLRTPATSERDAVKRWQQRIKSNDQQMNNSNADSI